MYHNIIVIHLAPLCLYIIMLKVNLIVRFLSLKDLMPLA